MAGTFQAVLTCSVISAHFKLKFPMYAEIDWNNVCYVSKVESLSSHSHPPNYTQSLLLPHLFLHTPGMPKTALTFGLPRGKK
jgi:hypothetical protein